MITPAQVTALAEFAKRCIAEGSWRGCDFDGAAQDWAVELGLLTKTTYDPAVHGENDVDAEPGDPWYVFSEWFEAALAKVTA